MQTTRQPNHNIKSINRKHNKTREKRRGEIYKKQSSLSVLSMFCRDLECLILPRGINQFISRPHLCQSFHKVLKWSHF
uniref:Uncharacterized protein n=1 Tax=Arundo donax TaxID=35708 RepID=A0A0A9AJK0_ARUDO